MSNLWFVFSGLKDLDITSKSDPCCVLYLAEGSAGNFFEVGRTEVIKNNLNPEFATKFQINYKFEEKQVICSQPLSRWG